MPIGSVLSPRGATPRQGQSQRLGSLVPGFLGASQGNCSKSPQPARTRLPWPSQTAKDLPQHRPQVHETPKQNQPLTPEPPRFQLQRRAPQQPPQDLPPMLENGSLNQGGAASAPGNEGQLVRKAEPLQQGLSRTPRATRVELGSQITPRRGVRQNRSMLSQEASPFEHEKTDDGDFTKIPLTQYNLPIASRELKLTKKLYNFMRASNSEGCANLFTTFVSRDAFYGSTNEKIF